MAQDINDLKLEVGLLKKDFQLIDKLCESLSVSITKLEEVNTDLLKMITLHEQKHQQHEKVENEVKDDIKELHSRITTVSREIHDRMDDVERHIANRIDELRFDLFNEKLKEQDLESKEEIKEKAKIQESLKDMDKYKWMIVGAATAIGWLVGNVNLNALSHLFK